MLSLPQRGRSNFGLVVTAAILPQCWSFPNLHPSPPLRPANPEQTTHTAPPLRRGEVRKRAVSGLPEEGPGFEPLPKRSGKGVINF